MSDWRPIETIPSDMMDGRPVRLKREHEGRVVCEGNGVFASLAEEAPMRTGVGPDPLGRLSAGDYSAEAAAVLAFVDQPRWLKPDRRFAFPAPTHFMLPAPPSPSEHGPVTFDDGSKLYETVANGRALVSRNCSEWWDKGSPEPTAPPSPSEGPEPSWAGVRHNPDSGLFERDGGAPPSPSGGES